MASKGLTAEQRLTNLEEFMQDVSSVTRIRLEHFPKVLELCVEAAKTRQFWA